MKAGLDKTNETGDFYHHSMSYQVDSLNIAASSAVAGALCLIAWIERSTYRVQRFIWHKKLGYLQLMSGRLTTYEKVTLLKGSGTSSLVFSTTGAKVFSP